MGNRGSKDGASDASKKQSAHDSADKIQDFKNFSTPERKSELKMSLNKEIMDEEYKEKF